MDDDRRDGTINQLFDESEEDMIPVERQLWGKNPKRVEALRDLWFRGMMDHLKGSDVPADAVPEVIFSMAVNNVLDMVMESVPADMALEMSLSFDHLMGVFIANQRYGVDILDAAFESLKKVNRDDYGSDEEFEAAVEEREERWWTVGKQVLSGRSPNDVIAEALSRYGLNR